ncbi:MAG: hypothetical protein HKM04_10950 [Legionellales bacterium]|nr:hypothetical protein [Legionellales bacterium]
MTHESENDISIGISETENLSVVEKTINKSNQSLKKIPRYSHKHKASVYVAFKPEERNSSNSGNFGFCQIAQSSWDEDEQEIYPIVTESGRVRGRKEYRAESGESDEHFSARIKEYQQNYLEFRQASKSEPLFYNKEVDGEQIRHATMHTFFEEGMDLADYLSYNQQLSFKEKLDLLNDIARQLATKFHAKEIAHRDLKPANIIINTLQNRVVLIDLDNIKKFTADAKTFSGTPGYIPLIDEDDDETGYQDIFALGMIGIEILLNGVIAHGTLNTAFDNVAFTKFRSFFQDNFSLSAAFTEDEKNLTFDLFVETREIFLDQAFGQLSEQQAIQQAQNYFEAQWKEKRFVDNETIFILANRFFTQQANDYKITKFPYKNQSYKVSAYTQFALLELKQLELNGSFQLDVPDSEQLVDILIRTQLSDPDIAPSATELYEMFQNACLPESSPMPLNHMSDKSEESSNECAPSDSATVFSSEDSEESQILDSEILQQFLPQIHGRKKESENSHDDNDFDGIFGNLTKDNIHDDSYMYYIDELEDSDLERPDMSLNLSSRSELTVSESKDIMLSDSSINDEIIAQQHQRPNEEPNLRHNIPSSSEDEIIRVSEESDTINNMPTVSENNNNNLDPKPSREEMKQLYAKKDGKEAIFVGGVCGGTVFVATVAAALLGGFVGAAAVFAIGMILTTLIARKLGKSTGRKEGDAIQADRRAQANVAKKDDLPSARAVTTSLRFFPKKKSDIFNTQSKNYNADFIQNQDHIRWAGLR